MRSMDDFISVVGDQIRWKRARKPLLSELEAHIADRRDALTDAGVTDEEAEAQAVLEMGDPEEIGIALDRLHRPRPNWLLIGCTAALLLTGIMLLWAVGDRETYLPRMLVYAGLGAAALVGGYFLDYTLLARCPSWVLFAMCGMCAVFPMVGGLFYSTASQLCYVLPVLFIPLVYRARGGEKRSVTIMLFGASACVFAAMFNSFVTSFIYAAVVCCGMIIYGASKGWFGKKGLRFALYSLAFPVVTFGLLCINSCQSLTFRLMTAVFDPESDPYGFGWVSLRVRELISTSRLFGEGDTSELLGDFLKMPNEINSVDYMLATASHRYGFVIFILVTAIAAAVGVVIVRGIRHQSCRLGSLTVLTVGLCLGVRALSYIIGNLGVTLISMDGLPLFSYCGKLMVLDMLVMGLLLSVFRSESIARDSNAGRNLTAAG